MNSITMCGEWVQGAFSDFYLNFLIEQDIQKSPHQKAKHQIPN